MIGFNSRFKKKTQNKQTNKQTEKSSQPAVEFSIYMYAIREEIRGKSGSIKISHKVFKSKCLGHMVSYAGHMSGTTFLHIGTAFVIKSNRDMHII